MIILTVCAALAAIVTVIIVRDLAQRETPAQYRARVNADVRRENRRNLNDPGLYIRRAGDRNGVA